jgi:lysozyme
MSWWQRLFGVNTTDHAPISGNEDIVLPAPVAPAGVPSLNCISLIQHMEGLSLKAYPDVDGVYVIGYGCKFADGKPVQRGQVIDAAGADRVCREKAQECASAILVLVKRSLKQGQLDALVDFVYNCGLGALASSTILRTILATQPVTEDMFTRWNKIHVNGQLVVLPQLTARRQAEYRLWIS